LGGGGGFPKSSTLVAAGGGPGASLAGCAAAPFARGAAASKHFKRAAESAMPAHFAISVSASPAESACTAPATKIENKASTRICMENSRLAHLPIRAAVRRTIIGPGLLKPMFTYWHPSCMRGKGGGKDASIVLEALP
jgi:hypothetical protein